MLLVTGGAGFIGANFVLDWLAGSEEPVVNLDKLTYAGNLDTLKSLSNDPRYQFARGDIGDRELVENVLAKHRPRAVINFAAEAGGRTAPDIVAQVLKEARWHPK